MTFIYIFLASLILQSFLPWWVIGPVAFTFAALRSFSAKNAFGSGFLAIFSLWIIVAVFKSLPNENILANRIAKMLSLPDTGVNWLVVLLITGAIGGISAGLAGLSGYYFRSAVARKRTDELSLPGEQDKSRRNIFHKVKRTV